MTVLAVTKSSSLGLSPWCPASSASPCIAFHLLSSKDTDSIEDISIRWQSRPFYSFFLVVTGICGQCVAPGNQFLLSILFISGRKQIAAELRAAWLSMTMSRPVNRPQQTMYFYITSRPLYTGQASIVLCLQTAHGTSLRGRIAPAHSGKPVLREGVAWYP